MSASAVSDWDMEGEREGLPWAGDDNDAGKHDHQATRAVAAERWETDARSGHRASVGELGAQATPVQNCNNYGFTPYPR